VKLISFDFLLAGYLVTSTYRQEQAYYGSPDKSTIKRVRSSPVRRARLMYKEGQSIQIMVCSASRNKNRFGGFFVVLVDSSAC